MKCNQCDSIINDNAKYCPECGVAINVDTAQPIYVQKSICLICKGRGYRRMKRYIFLSILSVVFIFTPLLLLFGATEGSTGILGYLLLVISSFLWGVKKRKCSTCSGKGSIIL